MNRLECQSAPATAIMHSQVNGNAQRREMLNASHAVNVSEKFVYTRVGSGHRIEQIARCTDTQSSNNGNWPIVRSLYAAVIDAFFYWRRKNNVFVAMLMRSETDCQQIFTLDLLLFFHFFFRRKNIKRKLRIKRVPHQWTIRVWVWIFFGNEWKLETRTS